MGMLLRSVNKMRHSKMPTSLYTKNILATYTKWINMYKRAAESQLLWKKRRNRVMWLLNCTTYPPGILLLLLSWDSAVIMNVWLENVMASSVVCTNWRLRCVVFTNSNRRLYWQQVEEERGKVGGKLSRAGFTGLLEKDPWNGFRSSSPQSCCYCGFHLNSIFSSPLTLEARLRNVLKPLLCCCAESHVNNNRI